MKTNTIKNYEFYTDWGTYKQRIHCEIVKPPYLENRVEFTKSDITLWENKMSKFNSKYGYFWTDKSILTKKEYSKKWKELWVNNYPTSISDKPHFKINFSHDRFEKNYGWTCGSSNSSLEMTIDDMKVLRDKLDRFIKLRENKADF